MAVRIVDQQDLSRLNRDYWQASRGPLASLIFIMPALAVYETGILLLGARAMRNGADVWLRTFLDLFGFGQYLLLPVLTISLLLAWHHVLRERWQLSPGVLLGMLLECVVLGLTLVTIGRIQGSLLHSLATVGPHPTALIWPLSHWSRAGLLIGFLGAGIYEEILFRLTLVPLACGAWQLLGGNPRLRTAFAIVATSLLFSAAHYVGPQGEHFEAYSFLFRFLAGGFFGLLFLQRGFGIAAGTHALYDICVGMS
jgi:hypothetical protein